MTDKNDSDQKNLPADFDDDDEIIELTKEVFLKPKKDEKDIELQDAGKDVPGPPVESSIDAAEEKPDSDEDIFGLDHTADMESGAEGTVLDLDEAFAEDAPPMGEDEIIASAIAESLSEDEEEPAEDTVSLSDDTDSRSEEDDVITMNQEDDESSGTPEGGTAAAEQDEAVFDGEEEIELEYESSEDEYDFFAMDEKETLEELDTISMTDDEPEVTAEKEMAFDPLADLNLDSAGDDEIIAMEADSHPGPELMAFDDEEALEFEGDDDLPDMTDELEFEDAEDLPDLTDELEIEEADALPDLTDEVAFEEAAELPELRDEVAFEDDDDLPVQPDEMAAEGTWDLPDLRDEIEFEDDDDLSVQPDEMAAEGTGDLPDLADEIQFGFDDDDQVKDDAGSDDQAAESSDDIIARSVEQSLGTDEVTSRIDLAMGPDFEFTEDGDGPLSDSERAAEEELTAKTKEELRALADADDLPDFDDDGDLEFEDEVNMAPEFEDETEETDIDGSSDLDDEVEVLDIDELEEADVEADDDIIEITEFDEHFPEEDEKKLERAGVLSASRQDEDDFLELIEVEDDDLAEDEEVIEFGETEDTIDEDELDSFFSESMEDGPLFENEEDGAAEETPALSTDMAMATASTADEDDEFDFNIDSSDISQQVDRLDTFLSDDSDREPEVASLPAEGFDVEEIMDSDEPATEGATLDDDRPEDEKAEGPLPVSPDEINAIVERVINDKFGGKIEHVIYEAIEKAVSKEIDRLKDALLDTDESGPNDSE